MLQRRECILTVEIDRMTLTQSLAFANVFLIELHKDCHFARNFNRLIFVYKLISYLDDTLT